MGENEWSIVTSGSRRSSGSSGDVGPGRAVIEGTLWPRDQVASAAGVEGPTRGLHTDPTSHSLLYTVPRLTGNKCLTAATIAGGGVLCVRGEEEAAEKNLRRDFLLIRRGLGLWKGATFK